MELEVNKSHKKIDLKNLKRSSRNILIGGIVGLSIFSGVNQTPVYASSTSISNDASSTNIEYLMSTFQLYKLVFLME